jgi:hypothetical protein
MRLSDCDPRIHAWGIEIAPLPWLISVCRGLLRNSRVKFIRGSYYSWDLSQFDVVFCYLSPAAMPDIWEKAQAEMLAGSILLSYEFVIPNVPPTLIIKIEKDAPNLYVWRI